MTDESEHNMSDEEGNRLTLLIQGKALGDESPATLVSLVSHLVNVITAQCQQAEDLTPEAAQKRAQQILAEQYDLVKGHSAGRYPTEAEG